METFTAKNLNQYTAFPDYSTCRDFNGNLTSNTKTSGDSINYSYDGENRLVMLKTGSDAIPACSRLGHISPAIAMRQPFRMSIRTGIIKLRRYVCSKPINMNILKSNAMFGLFLAASTFLISGAVLSGEVIRDGSLHGLFEGDKVFASTNALGAYCERKQVPAELAVVKTDGFEYCFVMANPYSGFVMVHLFVFVRREDRWLLFMKADLRDCTAALLKFKPNGKHVDIFDSYEELLLKVRYPTPQPKVGPRPSFLPSEGGK